MGNMNVFVAYRGDRLADEAAQATLKDSADDLSRLNQRIQQANGILKAWAESHGGRVIAIMGDGGRLEVGADHLSELPQIRQQYEQEVGASVSVGVGKKLFEAEQALEFAVKGGGDKLELWTPELPAELASLQDPNNSVNLFSSYLDKAEPALNDDAAGGGMTGPSQSTPASPAAPVAEGSEHSENEALQSMLENQPQPVDLAGQFSQLAEMSEGQEQAKKEQQVQQQQADEQNDNIRAALVEVLKKFKAQTPLWEQLKEAQPEAYKTLMAVVQAMVALAKQVYSGDQQEQPVQKSEDDLFDKSTLPMSPMHSTVEGFLTQLKGLPKEGAHRGKFITQHMNHGPFLSALQAHPQGKQVHAMLTQFLNGKANAGVGVGAQVVAKKDLMPGGKGDDKPDSDFDSKQLKDGQGQESEEHGLDPQRAKEIAKDHLTEDPKYYKAEIPQYAPATPEAFESAISRADQSQLENPREYSNKKLWLAHDGNSGYGLTHDGELVNVFSLVRGHGKAAVQHAVSQGAKHLTAFDGHLPKFYSQFGFAEAGRDKNWTPGGPDVVSMRLAKTIPVKHFSSKPGLTELDPKFQGTGQVGAEKNRPNRIPRTYYYMRDAEPEGVVTAGAAHQYHGNLPANTRLYDMGADELGLNKPSWKQTKYGQEYNVPDLDSVERTLARKGYHGYSNYGVPGALAYFHKLPVRAVSASRSPVMKRKLTKALPRGARLDVANPGDQTENIANQSGFMNHPVAQDQFMQGVANASFESGPAKIPNPIKWTQDKGITRRESAETIQRIRAANESNQEVNVSHISPATLFSPSESELIGNQLVTPDPKTHMWTNRSHVAVSPERPAESDFFWNHSGEPAPDVAVGVPVPDRQAWARSPLSKRKIAKAGMAMTVHHALQAGKTGRHQVILPVGSQKDAAPNATRDVGKLKVADPATGQTKWRSVRAGLVMAPDGTPTSSRHPNPGK